MRQANQYVRMEEEPGALSGLAPEARGSGSDIGKLRKEVAELRRQLSTRQFETVVEVEREVSTTDNSRVMQAPTLSLRSLDSLELEPEELGLTESSRLLQAHRHESVDSRHRADTAVSAKYGNPESVWHFVEFGWFQGLAASVIGVNLLVMGLEANNFGSSSFQEVLLVINNVLLCFYLFELCARALYFRGKYLCGEFSSTAWNYLDVVVVAAGVADQWLMPLLPHSISGSLEAPLRIVRFLRVFRALKIIRIFLESDLSWTESGKYQSFIGLVIAFNSVLMGLETDVQWGGWSMMELALLVIYTFDLSCALKRSGFSFFSCSNADITWNILDFTIVASSIADSWLVPLITMIADYFSSGDEGKAADKGDSRNPMAQLMMLMRMLRLLRILRLIKLVKSVRPLFMLVQGMLTSLQGVFWVLVLTIVALYACGLVATRLVGHALVFPDVDVPEHVIHSFSTVPNSMFTLFRVMCGSSSSDESQAIDWMMEEKPTARFAFVFFMVTSSWTLLSILTAVVSERMICTTTQQERELQLSQHEETQAEKTESLEELFHEMDKSGDGNLSKEEIETFLECGGEKFAEVSRICNVSTRDFRDVMKTLYHEAEPDIKKGVFMERLIGAGEQVTELSIMKLNRRFEDFEEVMSKQFEALTKQLRVAPQHQTQQQQPLQPQQQQTQQGDVKGDVKVDQPAEQEESVVPVSKFVPRQPLQPVQHHVDAALLAPEAYAQLWPLREALDQNSSKQATVAAKLEQLAEQTCTHTYSIARLQQAIEEAVVVRLDAFKADQAPHCRLPNSVSDSTVSAEHSKQDPQWPKRFPEFQNHDRFADMSPDSGGAQKLWATVHPTADADWSKAFPVPISPSTRGSTVDHVEFQVPEAAWALQPRPL